MQTYRFKTRAYSYYLLPLFLLSTVAQAARDREVTVTGVCNHVATPDRGSIVLTAETLELEAGTSSKNATVIYNRVRDAIKKLALEDVQLSTSEYSVEELKEWQNNKSVFKGYKTRIGLRIETSAPQRVGDIIAVATQNNLKDVSKLALFLSTEKMMKEQIACLREATENAHNKAEKLALGLGAHVGDVITITENQNSPGPRPPSPVFAMIADASSRSAPPPVAVETGQQEINVSIQVIFGLK